MEAPSLGYRLRYWLYPEKRWNHYLASLYSNMYPVPPTTEVIPPPLTDAELTKQRYEKVKDEWLANQVSSYAFDRYKDACDSCSSYDSASIDRMTMEEYKEWRKKVLEAQPFRDPEYGRP